MVQSCARPMTPEEYKQGYAVCDCGKYAHVFRAATLAKLPKGYNGELCKECSCLMVAVEKLTPNVLADRREPIGEASNERSECGRAAG